LGAGSRTELATGAAVAHRLTSEIIGALCLLARYCGKGLSAIQGKVGANATDQEIGRRKAAEATQQNAFPHGVVEAWPGLCNRLLLCQFSTGLEITSKARRSQKGGEKMEKR